MSFLEKIRNSAGFRLKIYSRSLLDSTLLTVCAVAVSTLAAFFCSLIITPAWNAPGWPSYYQYAKNVESKALTAALLSTIIFSLILGRMRSPVTRALLCLLLTIAALLLVYRYLHIEAPLTWINPICTLFIILGFTYYFLSRHEVAAQAFPSKPAILVIAGALGIFYAFLRNLFLLFPGQLDLHHHGEKFTSAFDFANGGLPFVTYFWPHGYHDTGMISLVFKVLSTVDFPTMLIGEAFSTSLGAVSILLISYGFGLGFYSILVMAALLVFNHSINLPLFSQLLFVIPAFLLYARGSRWIYFFLSGLMIFVAHIYRIEAGIYGAMSIAGLAALQLFASVISRDLKSFKAKTKNLSVFSVAVLIAMISSYLLLGWPGPEWYRIAFITLPKYLSDSAGYPFPLPIDTQNYFMGLKAARYAVVYYCSVIGLFSITTVFVARRITAIKTSDYFFVLLVLLSVVSLRTAFGRSDYGHIYQYFNLVYFILLLCLASVIVRSGLGMWQKAAVLSVVFVSFNFWTGSFNKGPFMRHDRMLMKSFRVVADYTRERPPQCSEGMFSENQLKMQTYKDYDKAVCDTKNILAMFNVRSGELLVSHSASLIYPSIGFKPPTSYYCLGWAITNDMQRELIADLEGAKIKAVLIAKGFRAMGIYNIPDEIRLPVYYRWLEENFDTSSALTTPLGDLVLSRSLGIDFSKPIYTPQGYIYLRQVR